MKPLVRTAAAIVAAGVILVASGCGGTGSHVAQFAHDGALAFSRCMRAHGVSQFPDPDSSGALPKRQVAQLAAGSPRFVPAHRACEHLLPNAGQPTRAQVRQAWNDMRNFARCMRGDGVPNWPDPAATSQQDQRPFFHTPESVDPDAPRIATAIRACEHVFHANNPLVTTQ